MPSIFEKYDLKQVINTSGRMTALGVSTPRPEVVEAAMAGMNQYFEMKDLVNKNRRLHREIAGSGRGNRCLLRLGGDRPVGGWRIG